MILFGPDTVIDAVQNMKRMVVNQFITDEVVRQAAHNYIDSQTQFARMLVKNTFDITANTFGQCGTIFPEVKVSKVDASNDTHSEEK
jgi:hypothetical protein